MKLTRQSALAAGTLLIGGLLGASALMAAASGSTWVPAPSTPPNCDSSIAGCNAPINVGSVLQTKTGWFGTNGIITNNLYVASGTISTAGSVLTNDGLGNAKWATATAAAVQECGADGYMMSQSDGQIDDWGTSGSGDKLEFYCRNHVVRICLSKDPTCPWRTSITSDDGHTCSGHSTQKAGNAPGYFTSAPPAICSNQSPCTTSSKFNPAASDGHGNLTAYQKYTNTWYACDVNLQKTVYKDPTTNL